MVSWRMGYKILISPAKEVAVIIAEGQGGGVWRRVLFSTDGCLGCVGGYVWAWILGLGFGFQSKRGIG